MAAAGNKLSSKEIELFNAWEHRNNFPNATVLVVQVQGRNCESLDERIYRNIAMESHAEELFLKDVAGPHVEGEPHMKIDKVHMFMNYSPCYFCVPDLIKGLAGIETAITYARGNYTELTEYLKKNKTVTVGRRNKQPRNAEDVVEDSIKGLRQLEAKNFILDPPLPKKDKMPRDGDALIKYKLAWWEEKLKPFSQQSPRTDEITAGIGGLKLHDHESGDEYITTDDESS